MTKNMITLTYYKTSHFFSTVIPPYSERVGAAKCVHYNGDSL